MNVRINLSKTFPNRNGWLQILPVRALTRGKILVVKHVKFGTFSDLFKSPLLIIDDDTGETEELELNLSAEPELFLVDEGAPFHEEFPVADVELSNGGGATLVFDCWPPRFNGGLNVQGMGHIVSKEEFLRRVNSLLADK